MTPVANNLDQKRHRFLSLRWKVALLLTAIFSVMNVGYVYLTYLHLDEQFENQLADENQRALNQLTNELINASNHQQQLTESLIFHATGSDDPRSVLIQHIDSKWPTMEAEWELESAAIYNKMGKLESKWGLTYTDDGERNIALKALKEKASQKSISCTEQCYLVNAMTLDDSGIANHVIVVKTSLSKIIERFTAQNQVGVALIQQGRTALDEHYIKNWHYSIVAITESERYLPLLENSTESITPERLLQLGSFYIDDFKTAYNIQMITLTKLLNDGQHALPLLIKDVSEEREAINKRLMASILVSSIWTIIAEIIMLAFLWRPLDRINRQAEVLPLLALGDYSFRNYRYTPKSRFILASRDELNVLEDTSAALSQQLYEMSVEINLRSKELEKLALFDTLTGLANRRMLINKLEAAIDRYKRTQEPFAVLFFDLDHFKRINDSLGHDAGDELLKTISNRLLEVTRSTDTVARLGGDEFTVLLTEIHGPKCVLDATKKVLDAIRKPIKLANTDVLITSSIGIAMAPENGLEANLLMKNADLAMYQAKNLGRNDFYFFTEQINENACRLLRQENELRLAMQDNQFYLVYQPLVDIKTGKAVGMEALVRWKHPERGTVMPNDFIPIMENNRMIVELGEKIIEMACRDMREFLAYNSALSVAINLSPRQLKDAALLDVLKSNICKYNIPPSSIKLEITEGVLMEDIDRNIVLLDRLKALGVTLSIDDFGTGYSSLSYLKKLPVDELKIDREFIKDIPMDEDDMEITAAVIAMAHKLRLTVVAEGIEDVTQVAFLLQNQCDYGQGYYYHRPQPKEVIKKLLHQQGVFITPPSLEQLA